MTSRALACCLVLLVLPVGCSPAGAPDAGSPSDDAGAGAADDAGAIDGGAPDAGTSSGAPCTFNEDCRATERCECDEQTGCRCALGARGTGRVGVDPCTDGDDCETALCVEGPGGTFYCSGPCATEAECAGALPVCADIALLGRICIREAS